MSAATRKDIAKSIKTLLVVLQSMRGQQVVVTLRNDSIVTGTIVKVDSNMNIELSDVLIEPDPFYSTTDECDDTIQEESESKPYLLVKGTRVRHIEVPEDFDLIAEAKQEINRIKNRTKQWTKDDII